MKPEKWNGTVIEVLDKEHGKKVIEWWKEQGVEGARGYGGDRTKEAGHSCIYYGIINGRFDNYPITRVINHNAKIITLPESFPEKWYMVCTEENQEVANEWRKSVAKTFLTATPSLGEIFISEPFKDNSYYLSGSSQIGMVKDLNLTEITFQQFLDNVYKPKQSSKMKITSEQAQQIIDMVSPSCKWKERLLDLWAKSIVLKQEIYVDDSLYKEGYKDASESQRKVLDGIFGKSKEIDLINETGIGRLKLFIKSGDSYSSLISVRVCDSDLYGKAFYLNDDFNWELKKDSLGTLCLIPTNK